ncbi:hypothetical protein [Zooshikella sp. RANM57]|uniref:hypothetical protein n=1 Tax=Zooshikella sp. RANM57 TaxID=3425863 RepID=UPI003D6E14AA
MKKFFLLLLLVFSTVLQAETIDGKPPFAREINCPPITYDQYLKIKQGMTYDEVVATVGGLDGFEIARSANFVSYAWGSPAFYCLTAHFIDGKLNIVSQAGLKR